MGRGLITGATGGIGFALVAALTSGGHKVIVLGRESERLHELEASGARPLAVDLREPERIAEAVGEVGGLDALIHCAGFSAIAPVADTSPAIWRETLMVNVASAAELTRLALPALRRSQGHVVF